MKSITYRRVGLLEQITGGVVAELADAREGRDALRARRSPLWEPLDPTLEDDDV